VNDAGPRALVTGAAGGIGLAAAARLARQGWQVALADIQGDAVKNAATELGDSAFAIELDVSDPAAVAAAGAHLEQRWSGLEGLVLAAGIELNKPLASSDADDWDHVIGIVLSGQFLCLRSLLPLLRSAGGAVVCVGSVVGRAAYPGASAYATAKAGLEGLVRAAAIDCAPAVRVNCVLPGTTDTQMLRQGRSGAALDALLREAGERVPLGRVAEADEIAAAIAFLLSSDASYLTGSSLVVDGGLLARLATDV